MKSAKILIWFNAIVFFLYGIGFIFFPETLSSVITDNIPSSSSGTIDMRATYGGISTGFGLLLAYTTYNKNTIKLGVWGVIMIVGGMGIGRIVGLFLDGSPNIFMYIYLIYEIIAVALGLLILSKKDMKEIDS